MSLAPKKSTPNIRSLQASFEPQQHDTNNKHLQPIHPQQYHRSKAGDLTPTANMPSNQSRIASPTKSIDSVIESPATTSRSTSPTNRPLAKFRPSWIGPQPSKPTKADIAGKKQAPMEQRVSIEYTSHGLKPPVYIFTSLSQPQWEGVEMFPVKQMDGEFTFVRNFDVAEGEYQYKFRLGPGDWWVCDESKPIVDDGVGNRNNLVVVKAGEKKAVDSGHSSPERKLAAPGSPPSLMSKAAKPAEPKLTSAPGSPSGLMQKAAKHVEPILTSARDKTTALAPSAAPQIFSSADKGSQGQQTPEHERTDTMLESSLKGKEVHHELEDADNDAEPYAAPLLRHESMSPTSHEQEHSPLFRHETIGLGYNHHEDAAPHTSMHDKLAKPVSKDTALAHIAPPEADPNDPSLHAFPTDHAGIVDHISRTHTRLAEDKTSDDVITSSPASSNAISDTSSLSGVPVLQPVNEEDDTEDDEQLENIREAAEQEAEDEEENGEEMDPLREGDLAEPEDADFEPKIPELSVVLVPVVEEKVEEVVIIDRRASVVKKIGTRNLMAVAVGLLAVLTGVAIFKLFK